jgi:hypothetical protein
MIMNFRIIFPLLLSLILIPAYAVDGTITISNPANGAMVSSKNKVPVTYAATLGTNGDHLHLYVDGKRVDVLREIKGNADLDPLPVGKHHVCLTVNTNSHAPTGVETCVDITSQ